MRPLRTARLVRARGQGRTSAAGPAVGWPTAYWAGAGVSRARRGRPASGGSRTTCSGSAGSARTTRPATRAGRRTSTRSRAGRRADGARARRASSCAAPARSSRLGLSPRDALARRPRGPNAHGQVVAPNFPTEEMLHEPAGGRRRGHVPLLAAAVVPRAARSTGSRASSAAGGSSGSRPRRDEDRDFLAAFLDSDPGARRLGEVALVDRTSRIGRTPAGPTSTRSSTRTPSRTSPSARLRRHARSSSPGRARRGRQPLEPPPRRDDRDGRARGGRHRRRRTPRPADRDGAWAV